MGSNLCSPEAINVIPPLRHGYRITAARRVSGGELQAASPLTTPRVPGR